MQFSKRIYFPAASSSEQKMLTIVVEIIGTDFESIIRYFSQYHSLIIFLG